MTTSLADRSNARVIAAGYQECLTKPIEAETLVVAVERLVARRAAGGNATELSASYPDRATS
jgi:CheY-like chemotaxis protein